MLLRTYQLSLHSGETPNYGPRPLDSTRRHGLFLNLTCDISLSELRHGGKKYTDMKHGYFLNSTCNIGEDKRQRHATLPFHKIDMRHWGPPIKGPQTQSMCTLPFITYDIISCFKQWKVLIFGGITQSKCISVKSVLFTYFSRVWIKTKGNEDEVGRG